MRIVAISGIAVGLMTWAGVALADPDAATSAPAPAATAVAPAPVASAEDADRVICRMSPAPTGSRLGSSRECHTQKQWDMMHQQAQENVNNMQVRGMASGPSGH
jgi:hypothetical protein